MKAIITTANKSILQEDGSEFLDVGFDILNDEGEKVDAKRIAFPIVSTAEEVQAAVAKYVETYQGEAAHFEANKAHDEAHAQADATIAEVVGKEISTPSPADVAETPEN